MDERVYEVDKYIDQIRHKKLQDVVKRQQWNEKWGHENPHIFETEFGAQEYLLGRAKDRVTHAKDALHQAEVKLVKLQRKFSTNHEHGEAR